MIERRSLESKASSSDRPRVAACALAVLVKYTPGLHGDQPSEAEYASCHSMLSSFTRCSSSTARLPDDTLESVLVPLDGFGLVDAVGGANLALAPPALGNTLAGAGHADVEVHAVDTARR